MGIEKEISYREKNKLKSELKRGIDFSKEREKLIKFLKENNIKKPSRVTTEIFKKYNEQNLSSKDKQYISKLFDENKLARNDIKSTIKIIPLKYQLLEKLQSLNRIGESKFSVKMTLKKYAKENNIYINPLKNDGIYSHNTYKSYLQTSKEFERYLHQNHKSVKNIEDISKDLVKEYLLHRQNQDLSKWTVDKDLAALNKILGFNLTKKEVGLYRKFYYESRRSRDVKGMDSRYNPENYKNQILVAKATGIRRQSMLKIKPNDFIFDTSGTVYGVRVKEKGGKIRIAKVLDSFKTDITNLINDLSKYGFDKPCFDKYTAKIDNHAFRGEYARNLYAELVEKQGFDKKDYQGYDREILKEVSKNLGHNRITVVVQHYLR